MLITLTTNVNLDNYQLSKYILNTIIPLVGYDNQVNCLPGELLSSTESFKHSDPRGSGLGKVTGSGVGLLSVRPRSWCSFSGLSRHSRVPSVSPGLSKSVRAVLSHKFNLCTGRITLKMLGFNNCSVVETKLKIILMELGCFLKQIYCVF